MYRRTARLDLDNFNNDTIDGLHITSTPGSWLSIVHGFAGMITMNGKLEFSPYLPKIWKSYQFNIIYEDKAINVKVDKNFIYINNTSNTKINILVYNKEYKVESTLKIKNNG
jgi:maltose phosphorylase